jgi:hypothetical protein
MSDDMNTVSSRYLRPTTATERREPSRPPELPGAYAEGDQLVVDVADVRELPAGEADGLLDECILLACKRLDAALWPALEDLRTGLSRDPTAVGVVQEKGGHQSDIADALRSKPGLFVPRFRAALKESFERRRKGIPRGQRAEEAISMAVVEHGTHIATVALKSAVLAMREATSLEAFALDLRVRALLLEDATEGAFDNPFSSDYVCDALGTASRAIWTEHGVWRQIMRRLVRVLTPHIVELHRDMNIFLKERDVLPALNVYTHASRGKGQSRSPGGSALYQKLIDLGDPDTPLATHSVPERTDPAGIARDASHGNSGVAARAGNGNGSAQLPDVQMWTALVAALNYLQHAASGTQPPMDLGGVDGEALRNGTGNQLRTLKEAFAGKGGSPLDRVTIDIVAGVLDCVFDNPHLSDEIKAVFGRLQIPVLKAAVLDRRVLSDPAHPVRRLLENLVNAAIDLQPQSTKGAALIAVAQHIARRIHDDFDDNLSIFETASAELDAFLDAEQVGADEWLALNLTQNDRADAQGEAQAVLDARRTLHSVPPGVQAFLDHEVVERLTTISLAQGRDSPAWEAELAFVDELLWSIEPKASAADRKRLVNVLPSLLRTINLGWETDDLAQMRRSSLLLCLFEFHLRSLKSAFQDPAAIESENAEAAIAAPEPVKRQVSPMSEPDEYDAQVRSLRRGDWCEFTSEETEAKQMARLAWRSTLRRRLLFCYSDGSTALVHTPESLANAFRSGEAALAIEAVPLFDRAMTQLIAKRSQTGEFAATANADPAVAPA